jgi:PAS domain S-box-containing protein
MSASLLERESELATIAEALDEAAAGHGRMVVVEGPAGVGKTAVLAAARALAQARDVAALVGAAALTAALGALAGAVALSSEAGNPLGSTWVGWWTSDTVGMLAVGPIAIALREAALRPSSRRGLVESLGLIGAVAAVSLLVFGADPSVGGLRSALPAALALPLLVAASARRGAVTASLAGLTLTVIAARLTVEEHGPFANSLASTADRLLGVRLYVFVALTVSLAALVLMAMRRRAESQRDSEQRRVRMLIGTAFDPVITLDEDGLVTGWNPAAERAFGWARTEAIGRPLSDTIVPANLRLPYEATLEVVRRADEVSGIGQRITVDARGKSEREVPVEVTLSSIRRDGRVSFLVVAKDLSNFGEAVTQKLVTEIATARHNVILAALAGHRR